MTTEKDAMSTFILGWVFWAILFFCTYGLAWLADTTLIPISYTIRYAGSLATHICLSPLGMLACLYVAGWPIFGWIVLDG